jgi:protein phosphatase
MSIFRRKKRKSCSEDASDIIFKTEAPTETFGVGGRIRYLVGNMQGYGARARQEDSFGFINAFNVDRIKEEGMLFVVCDGMGGMKDGKIASETAIESIHDAFADMDRQGDIARQLRESIYKASEDVEAKLDGEGGSTAIAGIIYDDKLCYVSVGDSYFYMKRDNNLYRLNCEHNMCNEIYLQCIREGYINPDEGREDSEAAALTSFLGMHGLENVDYSVRPLPLKPGDVLLACSDGVGGVLDEGEVLTALGCETPELICKQLEENILMYHRKNQDNYTAIVVKCI